MQSKNLSFRIFILLLFAVSLFGCQKNEPPIISIIQPIEGMHIEQGTILIISADADDVDGSIHKVHFFCDDSLMGTVNDFPYNHEWNTGNMALGQYMIKATAFDDLGSEVEDQIQVEIVAAMDVAPLDSITEKLDTIAPLNILLSDTVIYDDYSYNILVGSFTTIDETSWDYYSYKLGSFKVDDNSCFYIRDNELYTSWDFFYDFRLEYTISVTSTDSSGNSFTRKFHLKVIRNLFKARLLMDYFSCNEINELKKTEFTPFWEKIKNTESDSGLVDQSFSAEFQIFSDYDSHLNIAVHVFDTSRVLLQNKDEDDYIDIFLSANMASSAFSIDENSWHIRLYRKVNNYSFSVETGMNQDLFDFWLNRVCVNVVDSGSDYYATISMSNLPMGFLYFNLGVANQSNNGTSDMLYWYKNNNIQSISEEMQMIFVSHPIIH